MDLADIDAPVPGQGETLVHVKAVGICGSDLHGVSDGLYPFSVVLGHEFAGVTDEGRRVAVAVPAAYTSQRCSVCGHVDPKSRESQAVFRCTTCGHGPVHADVNTANNILAAGLAVTACGELSTPAGAVRSSKQEPAGNREELLLQPHTAA